MPFAKQAVKLPEYPFFAILTVQEAIRQRFKKYDWLIPDECSIKLIRSAAVWEEESFCEMIAQRLEWALQFCPFPLAAIDHVTEGVWTAEAVNFYPELEPNSDRVVAKRKAKELCAVSASEAGRQVDLGEEISSQAIVDPAPDRGAKMQKANVTPIGRAKRRRKMLAWLKQTPDKFFEKKEPKWCFARLYGLVKNNNYHDSGVRQYWVLFMSQEEFSRKCGVGLRTVSRFFTACKRRGICLKIFKEDPPWKDLKHKKGPKDGHCGVWVFAKDMSQARHLSREWRSERPRLRKALRKLRPDVAPGAPLGGDFLEKRVKSKQHAMEAAPDRVGKE